MPNFIDKNGGTWSLELNFGMILDIKDQTGVDLDVMMKKPESLAEIVLSEPGKLISVLYVMCEDQCKEKNIDPRQFGRLFNREAVDSAGNAFIESLFLFYPRSSAGRAIAEQLPRILEKMDSQIEKKMKEKMNEVLRS